MIHGSVDPGSILIRLNDASAAWRKVRFR